MKYEIVGPCRTWHKYAETNDYGSAQTVMRAFGKGAAIYKRDTGNCVLRYR